MRLYCPSSDLNINLMKCTMRKIKVADFLSQVIQVKDGVVF